MVEKFNIELQQNVNINAALFNCEYFSDPTNKSQKPAENKDNYLQIESPLIILVAIGGDIDIYKFLADREVNQAALGHIGLSKKLKNSVISNVIGACAFYGRINLLHYLLEKSQNRLDINHKSTEKKSKTKQFSLHKEFADFTPVHLSLANDLNSEDDSIEILKLLQRYKADLTALDWNRNNILHLAVKFNKKRVVKYILEDLKYLDMIDVSNKEGQTAMAIAKSIDASEIFNYLETFSKSNQAGNDLEEELLELIEDTSAKKKKTKKNKKKKEDNLGVLGTTNEFQETLKPPKPVEVVPKLEEKAAVINVNNEKPKEKESKKLEEEYFEEEVEENEETTQSSKQYYERKSYFTNYGDNKNKKNYKYGYNNVSSMTNNYRSNPNYSNRNYENDYNEYDYSYKTYKQDSYYNNYNSTNTYGEDKKNGKYTQNTRYKNKNYESYSDNTVTEITQSQGQSVSTTDNLNKNAPRTGGIVGLSTKYDKKHLTKTAAKEAEKNVIETVVSSENKFVSEVVIVEGKNDDACVLQTNEVIQSAEDIQTEKNEVEIGETIVGKYEIKKIDEQEHENEEDLGEENFITDENVEDKDHEEEEVNKVNEIKEIHERPQIQITEEFKETEPEKEIILITNIEPAVEHEEKVDKDKNIAVEAEEKEETPNRFSETTEKELKELTVNKNYKITKIILGKMLRFSKTT
jgi:ankyrin repeat protein